MNLRLDCDGVISYYFISLWQKREFWEKRDNFEQEKILWGKKYGLERISNELKKRKCQKTEKFNLTERRKNIENLKPEAKTLLPHP